MYYRLSRNRTQFSDSTSWLKTPLLLNCQISRILRSFRIFLMSLYYFLFRISLTVTFYASGWIFLYALMNDIIKIHEQFWIFSDFQILWFFSNCCHHSLIIFPKIRKFSKNRTEIYIRNLWPCCHIHVKLGSQREKLIIYGGGGGRNNEIQVNSISEIFKTLV